MAETNNLHGGITRPIIARLPEVRKQVIKDCMGTFPDVAHRLEELGSVRGVLFINDSRATNVNAAWYALESMNRPVIWIAGGQDPGNEYAPITELVRKKVKGLICLGVNNKNILSALAMHVPAVCEATSMKEAVRVAYVTASPGDAVLLSPACPSFDRFEDYNDRGKQFMNEVYDL